MFSKMVLEGCPILIIAEDIEQEAQATLVVIKLRRALEIAALKLMVLSLIIMVVSFVNPLLLGC